MDLETSQGTSRWLTGDGAKRQVAQVLISVVGKLRATLDWHLESLKGSSRIPCRIHVILISPGPCGGTVKVTQVSLFAFVVTHAN